MQLKDLRVGDNVTIDLLVVTSTVRLTKNKKKYLNLSLTDGTDTITANQWNWGWSSVSKPERNSVVTVDADVVEWAGTKQLNVNSLTISTKDPTHFAPKGDFDIMEYIGKASSLIDSINHEELRNLTRQLYNDYAALWKTAPAANNVHHAYTAGTLQHCVDTAILAKDIANNIPECNTDLCIAGGLIHDIGKLWVYELDGAVINYTLFGHMLEHIVCGIVVLDKYKDEYNPQLIRLLQHIVAAHHGKLEYGSPVTPKFIEAWVVSYADDINAKANILHRVNTNCTDTLTEREWSLNNFAMVSQAYVEEVMAD